MKRLLFASLLCAAFPGCGEGTARHPSSLEGSFAIIEGAVTDLSSTVLDKRYRGARDLGTDSDRIGMALDTFIKATAGTSLAADAEEMRKKVEELEKLAASRAPVEKQREAAKALQATVAAIKAKL